MPLIRRIIKYGKTSRGLIIPSSWLKFYEDTKGCKIESVSIEVDGVLTIAPILSQKLTT